MDPRVRIDPAPQRVDDEAELGGASPVVIAISFGLFETGGDMFCCPITLVSQHLLKINVESVFIIEDDTAGSVLVIQLLQ